MHIFSNPGLSPRRRRTRFYGWVKKESNQKAYFYDHNLVRSEQTSYSYLPIENHPTIGSCLLHTSASVSLGRPRQTLHLQPTTGVPIDATKTKLCSLPIFPRLNLSLSLSFLRELATPLLLHTTFQVFIIQCCPKQA